MNKKFIPFVALAIAGGALTSCGQSQTFNADIFYYKFADTYLSSVREALDKDNKAIEGLEFKNYDANDNQATQTEQINNAISKGTDLLVVNAVEQLSAGENIMKTAQEAKTPVIFFNREVKDEAVAWANSVFVGTDPDEAGYMQGEMISDAIIDGDHINAAWDRNGDGTITYIMLRADVGNAEADGRTTYSVEKCNEILTAKGLPTLVQHGSDTDCGWDKVRAKEATDTLDPITNNVDLIIANNDDMAIGAIESLIGKGYNAKDADAEHKLLVVGVDATATAQTYIKNGQMYGSIKQDAEAMATCISTLINQVKETKEDKIDWLKGTKYEFDGEARKIRIPYAKFTA